MSKVYKFIELIGTSSDGYKEAIANGIEEAKKMHDGVRWFETLEQRGYLSEDGVAWYQAVLKIGYSD